MRTGRTLSGRLPDERALTDSHFNSIAAVVSRARALPRLAVRERSTGCDALLIIRYATGAVWGFALQAKILQSHKAAKPQEATPSPSYAQLGHVTGGMRQYDVLLRACSRGGLLDGFVPLHLFYNELVPAFPRAGWACHSPFPGDPGEFGCTVARSEDVKVIADARLALRVVGGRARFPISLLSPVCRPWLCLMCGDRAPRCRAVSGVGGEGDGGGGNDAHPWPPAPQLGSPDGDGNDYNGGLDLNPEKFEEASEFEPAPLPPEPIHPRPLANGELSGFVMLLLDYAAGQEPLAELGEVRQVLANLTKSLLVVDLAATEG